MLVKAKKHLKTLFNYAVTVVSSVVIIVFGISFLSRATTVTTTIGENISTNDLIVYGNATTTGAHYIGGNLTVAGDFTVSGAQTLSGAITIPYFTATSTTQASTITYRLGVATTSPYATLSVAGIGVFDDYVRASYFTATSTTATSTFPYLTSTQSNVGTVVGGTWQGTVIGTQYGGTGQNFSGSTGLIYLAAGTASATSTLAINVGGTGLATAPSYGQVLLGNSNGSYSLTATSSLGIVGMSIGNAVTSGTGGSVLFVDSSGNLAQNNSNLYWDNTNNRLGIGTTSPYAKLSVVGETVSSYFTATSTTATSTLQGTVMAVNAGNVGIGTVSPSNKLEVSGNITVGGAASAPIFLTVDGSSSDLTMTYYSGLSQLVIDKPYVVRSSAIQYLQNSVENTYAGGQALFQLISESNDNIDLFPAVQGLRKRTSGGTDVAVNAGDYLFEVSGSGYDGSANQLGGGMWIVADENFSTGNEGTRIEFKVADNNSTFSLADDTKMVIKNNGNVGIGTTSPYAKLSVVGDIALDSNVINFASSSASSLTLNYLKSATTTIPQLANAWTIATSTTARPILLVNGNNGQVRIGNNPLESAMGTNYTLHVTQTAGAAAVASFQQEAVGNGIVSIYAFSGVAGLALNTFNNTAANGNNFYGKRAGGTYSNPTGVLTGYNLVKITGLGYDSSGAYIEGNDVGLFMYAAQDFAAGAHGTYITFETTPNNSVTRAEVVRIDSTGNVGIGTTSPYAKLSVVGETVSSYFTATSTTASSTLPMIVGSQSSGGNLWLGSTQHATKGKILFGTSAYDEVNNRLGIGTASPSYALEVIGNAADYVGAYLRLDTNSTNITSGVMSGGVFANNNTTANNYSSLSFLSVDTNSEVFTFGHIANVFTSHTSGAMTSDLAFVVRDNNLLSEKMRIKSSGNVGIGTTSPYAKLSVVGETVSSYFTATSTTATSTLPYLTSTQIAITGLTAGSIPFIGTGGILAQNNSNLYWDNTNARLGVSSSTPYAKLSVTNSGAGPSFIVEDAASPDSSPFIIDASGNVGIGTSTPTAKLTVQGAGTGLNQTFAVFDSTNATSTFVVLDNGYVGVGTSTPWGRFSVEQGNNDTDVFIVADAGTSTPHMRIDGAGITTINRLNTGPMTFETNAGAVSWINLNVDTAVATGTIESYTAQIDDVSILTIYGEAAGAGLIGTTSVGVGTTTPVGYFTVNASSSSAALSVWQVNSATQGPIASFWDGGTEVFKIDSLGRVGIGTSTYASNLTIGDGTTAVTVEIGKGGLCVDSDGGCSASTTGRVSAVSFVTAASDIAENYFSDETLAAGDIVITKGGSMVGKADAENQNAVIGIVSTKPGIILGLENDNPEQGMPPSATGIYPVALAGRVPVKVNLEGGAIAVGDPLSLSSEDGVAKKASEPGKIIGYALENYDGPTIQNNGQILIFIDITYWFPPDYFTTADDAETADTADTADGALNAADNGNIIFQSFGWVLEQFKDIGVAIADGVVSAREFVAEKITAKKAAVDALEMKDSATGEIYCVKMENGELNKILGACPEN